MPPLLPPVASVLRAPARRVPPLAQLPFPPSLAALSGLNELRLTSTQVQVDPLLA